MAGRELIVTLDSDDLTFVCRTVGMGLVHVHDAADDLRRDKTCCGTPSVRLVTLNTRAMSEASLCIRCGQSLKAEQRWTSFVQRQRWHSEQAQQQEGSNDEATR